MRKVQGRLYLCWPQWSDKYANGTAPGNTDMGKFNKKKEEKGRRGQLSMNCGQRAKQSAHVCVCVCACVRVCVCWGKRGYSSSATAPPRLPYSSLSRPKLAWGGCKAGAKAPHDEHSLSHVPATTLSFAPSLFHVPPQSSETQIPLPPSPSPSKIWKRKSSMRMSKSSSDRQTGRQVDRHADRHAQTQTQTQTQTQPQFFPAQAIHPSVLCLWVALHLNGSLICGGLCSLSCGPRRRQCG